jgi:hypothetical protein
MKMMNEYTRRAMTFSGIVFTAFLFIFISITFFIAVDTRNDLTTYLASEPIEESIEESAEPFIAVDSPTYDDIIALATYGGEIDYVSIFYSGDSITYHFSVKYESDGGTTKQISIDRKESLSEIYNYLRNILISEGKLKE